MGLLQEITFLPVVGVIKTLHFIEHTAMNLSKEPSNALEDEKEQNCNQSEPSCTIIDVTEMDLSELDDEIKRKENRLDNKANIQMPSTCHSQGNSRRSSVYDSEGYSRRSSVYDSQKSSRRTSHHSLMDTTNEDLDEQLLLEADFFAKAFPRRALPSYVSDTLSNNVQR